MKFLKFKIPTTDECKIYKFTIIKKPTNLDELQTYLWYAKFGNDLCCLKKEKIPPKRIVAKRRLQWLKKHFAIKQKLLDEGYSKEYAHAVSGV